MALNRTNFNALVDGDEFTGTLWDKSQIKDVILDPVDAELVIVNAAWAAADAVIAATVAAKLPLAGGTLTGDLKFTDATYDIGKAGATRPRDGFFSRNVALGGLLTVTGFGTHAFSASGIGANALTVNNPLAGSGNYAAISVVSDTVGLTAYSFSSTWTSAGQHLQSGTTLQSDGSGGLSIVAINGSIRFYAGGTTKRWEIDAVGYLLPATNGTLSIGNASFPVAEIYAYTYRSSHSIPMASLNPTADSGTALIVNASGWMQKLTSSARFKEHLAPLDVTPDTLARFVDRAPKAWDYTGQQTGAVGFIAEDLDDLVPNDYGRSALLNYDAEGRPESNRDFAIIGLQHLVIQDLWRRVAALEGKRHA
jgi:hypothetical protein